MEGLAPLLISVESIFCCLIHGASCVRSLYLTPSIIWTHGGGARCASGWQEVKLQLILILAGFANSLMNKAFVGNTQTCHKFAGVTLSFPNGCAHGDHLSFND